MGEIGSLKNRFKTWWRNKKRQKKIEEQEIEDDKKKKSYNRFQVITRTIFGLFLGLLQTTIFATKKKENKVTVKKLEVEIQTVKQHTEIVKQKQQKIIAQIPKVKSNTELVEIKKEHQELKTEIVSLKKHQEKIGKQVAFLGKKDLEQLGPRVESLYAKKDSILPMITTQEQVLEELEQNQTLMEEEIVQKNQEFREEALEHKDVTIEEQVLTTKMSSKKKGIGIDTEREELRRYLKENNQLIKEIDKLMKRLSEPIDDTEIGMTLFAISNLYDKIFPSYLTESSIRHRIRFSKYTNDKELSKLDKVGFLLSDGIYKERLNQCEQKKRELQTRQYENEIKQKKQKKEEKVLEQKKEKVSQLELDKRQLKNTLLEQRVMIASLERSLDTLTGSKKKKGILSRIGRLVKNTLFTGLGITTILKSKRSMLGVLTGVLLTNHGIRGMRNMNRSKDDKINYFDVEKILEQIKSEKDALVMSLDFCSDSLFQLQDLKSEVIEAYPYTDDIEVTQLKTQLFELEEQLVTEQQKLMEYQQQMEIAYQKGVQKIKKLEEKSS